MTEYGCLDCGHQFSADGSSVTCPNCDGDFINLQLPYEPDPQGEDHDTASV